LFSSSRSLRSLLLRLRDGRSTQRKALIIPSLPSIFSEADHLLSPSSILLDPPGSSPSKTPSLLPPRFHLQKLPSTLRLPLPTLSSTPLPRNLRIRRWSDQGQDGGDAQDVEERRGRRRSRVFSRRAGADRAEDMGSVGVESC